LASSDVGEEALGGGRVLDPVRYFAAKVRVDTAKVAEESGHVAAQYAFVDL